ncbi:hypothetical protein COV94_06980 [Candidatus Woesearchaeota archaeon CG11_big_fil_rev_8_21_14_0_20_57_5]|nr:MAG: hypothetical protein COV94_06980 [Candidatus Woesearchaeota archaeon CG11_big_fil_rev_8_21_14_0_20_57_5]
MLIGVVGKANVGKSTFFKAATLMDVEIANYPFATIKPNHGVGFVRVPCADKHFGVQCHPRVGYCIDGIRFVPVDLIDVAGLVPGAHEGKGMGLEFLNDLNQADALIHVIDASGSTNEKGEPVPPGSRDPAEDIRFLAEELDYWYLGILKKAWDKFARTVSQTNAEPYKALHKQFSGLGSTEDMVKQILAGMDLDERKLSAWSDDELFGFSRELRKRTQPMLIAANKIDVPGALENVERLRKEFPELIIVPCSGVAELVLKTAAKDGAIQYVPGGKGYDISGALTAQQEKGLPVIQRTVLDVIGNTGVQEALDGAVFSLLKYMPIFPGGVGKLADSEGRVMPDCWLLRQGSTALDFAYKIHTDLGRGFIRAIDVKTKRTVGKEHVLMPGDVVEIVSDK